MVDQEKISDESALAQVRTLFEAFEAEMEGEQEERFIKSLSKAVRKGRLEINGAGDDIKITQHFRKEIAGKRTVDWNWMRLGLGRSRVQMNTEGLGVFNQQYLIAAPMIGITSEEIYTMHPVDLSLVEDIAGFFQLL